MVEIQQQAMYQSRMRSPEERESKIFDNLENAKKTHAEKLDKSNMHFKNTRVTSCSGVLMKSGKAICVAFNNGAQKPIDMAQYKSSETTALSQ